MPEVYRRCLFHAQKYIGILNFRKLLKMDMDYFTLRKNFYRILKEFLLHLFKMNPSANPSAKQLKKSSITKGKFLRLFAFGRPLVSAVHCHNCSVHVCHLSSSSVDVIHVWRYLLTLSSMDEAPPSMDGIVICQIFWCFTKFWGNFG